MSDSPACGMHVPSPAGLSGAITQVDWTRFDSVDYTDAPCALGPGGPVHRRDGEVCIAPTTQPNQRGQKAPGTTRRPYVNTLTGLKHSPSLGVTRAIWRDHSSRCGNAGIRPGCRRSRTQRGLRDVATVVTPDGASPVLGKPNAT